MSPIAGEQSVTEALATFALDNAAGAPPAVAHEAKRLLVHGLSATLASAAHSLGPRIDGWAGETSDTGPAGLLWTSRRGRRDVAALVIASHWELLGRSETYSPTYIHPTAGAAAGALVAADGRHVSGARFLAAIAIGVESAIAVSRMLLPAAHARGLAPVPLLTPVAAAAAYAVAAEFDREPFAHALGIALSGSAGLFENVGTLAGLYAIGAGARSGVAAAEAAAAGVSGPAAVVEGRRGLVAALIETPAEPIETVVADLGAVWRLGDLSYMRFAAETIVQAPLEATLAVAQQWPLEQRRDVASLRLVVAPRVAKLAAERYLAYTPLRTDQQVKGDVRYCAAYAWLRGSFDSAARTSLGDTDVLGLRDRIVVDGDPGLGPFAASVEAVGHDGTRGSASVAEFTGTPTRPLSDDQLLAELYAEAVSSVGTRRADVVRDVVWGVDELDDVQPLLAAISDAPAARR
jgi:2-methylcitrate dehydratase PrpD